MSNPNELDAASEGRLARARFGGALMSDTKWRKVFRALADADLGIREMLVKFIDVDQPKLMRFPPSLACPLPYMDTVEFGPTAFRSIEWLEFAADIEPTLNPLGQFPISSNEGRRRLSGYGY